MNLQLVRFEKPLENTDLARSNLPRKPEVDMVSIPLPPPMEEFKSSRSIPSNVASNSKSVLRFKATQSLHHRVLVVLHKHPIFI